MISRRDFVAGRRDHGRGARRARVARRGAGRGGAAARGRSPTPRPPQPAAAPAPRDPRYTPVVTPNGATLPWRIVDGVKVFHLIAEAVEHEFAPGLKAHVLGLQRPRARPDDRGGRGRPRAHLRHQPAARADDRPLARHPPAERHGRRRRPDPARRSAPGETFKYEFTLRQHGTFMYHSHHDEMTQMALGMMGMFVIHPRKPRGPAVDRDFALMLTSGRSTPARSGPTRTR